MTSEDTPVEAVVAETIQVAEGGEGSAVAAAEPMSNGGGIVARAVQEHIQIDLEPRKSTYYSVTDAEIDVYAQFGWLSTVFLSLSGTFLGFALGCVAAIGFTVALFIAAVAFETGNPVQDAAKMGALLSFFAAVVSLIMARILRIKKLA